MARSNTPDLGSLGGGEDSQRRQHTAKRLRLISGGWELDLHEHFSEHFSAVRARATGRPDMSTNVLQTVSSQTSRLYHTAPEIRHEDEESQRVMREQCEQAGLWTKGRRHQQNVVALRESLLFVTRTSDGARPQVGLITPDRVYAESSDESPETPNLLVVAQPREYKGEDVWTWDWYDIRDPMNPAFKILIPHAERPIDVTMELLGSEFSGPAYPYRYTQPLDDEPDVYIPLSLYHAEDTGQLWDSRYGIEMVDGTLSLAVLWSFWQHIVRDASWPQRVLIDAFVRGATKDGSGPAQSRAIETDPMSVLCVKSDGNNGGSINQWQAGADPAVVFTAIRQFERRLLQFYEVGGDDYESTGGGPESGHAISLKRETVREASARMEPQFRRGDLATIRMMAAQWNRGNGSPKIAETGYSIRYPSLPKTAQERQAEMELVAAKIDRGLMSRVDAYMQITGEDDRRTAIKRLAEIQQENRIVESGITMETPT